ncbi:MAG: nucleotidyltransferase domain-containing protein [bacterium]|jgi:predicted nucleotidyltransferase
MRLTPRQIESLKRTAAEVFGAQARISLFGSRVDDQRRGGDIDLYVSGAQLSLEDQVDAKLRFLVKAKQELGDQRIDLVFAPLGGQAVLPIHRMAEETGVLL